MVGGRAGVTRVVARALLAGLDISSVGDVSSSERDSFHMNDPSIWRFLFLPVNKCCHHGRLEKENSFLVRLVVAVYISMRRPILKSTTKTSTWAGAQQRGGNKWIPAEEDFWRAGGVCEFPWKKQKKKK